MPKAATMTSSHRGEPTQRERLVQHRGRSIELRSRREHEHGENRKEAGFAEGEALDDGESEARDRQRKSQPPRAIASIQQAAGDEQEHDADQTAEEMRCFHRPERQMRRQEGQPLAERRRRARDEQHDSRGENEDSDESRRQPCGDAGQTFVRVCASRRDREADLEKSE